jgi:hypothetical protein
VGREKQSDPGWILKAEQKIFINGLDLWGRRKSQECPEVSDPTAKTELPFPETTMGAPFLPSHPHFSGALRPAAAHRIDKPSKEGAGTESFATQCSPLLGGEMTETTCLPARFTPDQNLILGGFQDGV